MSGAAAAVVMETDGGYRVGRQGLTFTRRLTREEWTDVGRMLAVRLEGAAWALGDWLVYGGRDMGLPERVSQGNVRWLGSGYAEAARITGLTRSHLSNCFRVALGFPAPTRVAALKWSHHKEALALPKGERLGALRLAADGDWTADQVRQHVERRLKEAPAPKRHASRTGHTHPYVRAQVECPKCHERFPVKGHKVAR